MKPNNLCIALIGDKGLLVEVQHVVASTDDIDFPVKIQHERYPKKRASG